MKKKNIGVYFFYFPVAGNKKKNIFIMKNEKKKPVQKFELGYCPIVLQYTGLYCNRVAVRLEIVLQRFSCVAIQWSAVGSKKKKIVFQYTAVYCEWQWSKR